MANAYFQSKSTNRSFLFWTDATTQQNEANRGQVRSGERRGQARCDRTGQQWPHSHFTKLYIPQIIERDKPIRLLYCVERRASSVEKDWLWKELITKRDVGGWVYIFTFAQPLIYSLIRGVS